MERGKGKEERGKKKESMGGEWNPELAAGGGGGGGAYIMA